MILVAYRHGLRASELVDLRWDQIDFSAAGLHVRRSKLARRVRIRSEVTSCGPYASCNASRSLGRPSERGAPFGIAGFARMVERVGEAAGLAFKAHHAPACLRVYARQQWPYTRSLQKYLGHKNIQHAVRYIELSPQRFKNFWR